MEIKNYETPGYKVKFLCENILKHIATPEFKEVCENTTHKIFEILKKVNFSKLGDQEEFWIDIHRMLLKDDLWNSFITESVAVTKPEIASLFLYSPLGDHEKSIRTHQNTWSDFNKRGRKSNLLFAGYVVFSLRNKDKMLKSSKNRAVAVAALQFLDSVKIDGDSSFKSRSFNMYVDQMISAITSCRDNPYLIWKLRIMKHLVIK